MNNEEKRTQPRSKSLLFRTVIGINILIWLLMLVALSLYHYGRPEISPGFYEYLGVSVRNTWKEDYYNALVLLLQSCLALTLVSVFLRSKRSRRKNDDFGINLFFLIFIIAVSLITLTVDF